MVSARPQVVATRAPAFCGNSVMSTLRLLCHVLAVASAGAVRQCTSSQDCIDSFINCRGSAFTRCNTRPLIQGTVNRPGTQGAGICYTAYDDSRCIGVPNGLIPTSISDVIEPGSPGVYCWDNRIERTCNALRTEWQNECEMGSRNPGLHYCTSPGNDPRENRLYDCNAGTRVEPCTCSTGSARLTGTVVHSSGARLYSYTCCTSEIYGTNDGEQCGDYRYPTSHPSYCHVGETGWCTSPDGNGGYDCWAGTRDEPCTCSEGHARLTGRTTVINNVTRYHYNCCRGRSSGTNDGVECGDYVVPPPAPPPSPLPPPSAPDLTPIIAIAAIGGTGGLLLLLVWVIAYCICLWQARRQRGGNRSNVVEMRGADSATTPAPAVASCGAATPVATPPVVVAGTEVHPAVVVSGEPVQAIVVGNKV